MSRSTIPHQPLLQTYLRPRARRAQIKSRSCSSRRRHLLQHLPKASGSRTLKTKWQMACVCLQRLGQHERLTCSSSAEVDTLRPPRQGCSESSRCYCEEEPEQGHQASWQAIGCIIRLRGSLQLLELLLRSSSSPQSASIMITYTYHQRGVGAAGQEGTPQTTASGSRSRSQIGALLAHAAALFAVTVLMQYAFNLFSLTFFYFYRSLCTCPLVLTTPSEGDKIARARMARLRGGREPRVERTDSSQSLPSPLINSVLSSVEKVEPPIEEKRAACGITSKLRDEPSRRTVRF